MFGVIWFDVLLAGGFKAVLKFQEYKVLFTIPYKSSCTNLHLFESLAQSSCFVFGLVFLCVTREYDSFGLL